MKKKPNQFTQADRERAVRLVFEQRNEYASMWATIESIAPMIGCVPQTLHDWVRKHEVEHGMRDGVTKEERDRVKALEREVKELRRANEILKLASAFFAQAELDRRCKPWGRLSINTVTGMGSSRSAKCCRSPHPVIVATQPSCAILRDAAPVRNAMPC